jgi:PhoH-like ATPase
MMVKYYVLDTNVLLHDSLSIYKFDDNVVVLCISVLEELDSFKTGDGVLNRNARQVSRELDKLRQQGDLIQGVSLPNGGKLIISVISQEIISKIPAELSRDKVDNCLLATAKYLTELREKSDEQVVLVTKDINLRVKAGGLRVKTEDYRSEKIDHTHLYDGHSETVMTADQMSQLFDRGIVTNDPYFPNECITVRDVANPSHTVLAIYKQGVIRALPKLDQISRITPKNREQTFALHLLLDDSVPLVTISGAAGTGKSLMALAVGLSKVQSGVYTRMLVSKPTMPMGGSKNDLGFLPGSLSEKLTPWLAPIKDNLDVICNYKHDKKTKRSAYDDLEEQGLIQAESLAHIRGRSLPKQYIWVDEAQNMSPSEVKTVLTRIGEGSKCILSGDPTQIDSSYLDSGSNGLSLVVERFKESDLSAHITLSKTERSPLSELAARLL